MSDFIAGEGASQEQLLVDLLIQSNYSSALQRLFGALLKVSGSIDYQESYQLTSITGEYPKIVAEHSSPPVSRLKHEKKVRYYYQLVNMFQFNRRDYDILKSNGQFTQEITQLQSDSVKMHFKMLDLFFLSGRAMSEADQPITNSAALFQPEQQGVIHLEACSCDELERGSHWAQALLDLVEECRAEEADTIAVGTRLYRRLKAFEVDNIGNDRLVENIASQLSNGQIMHHQALDLQPNESKAIAFNRQSTRSAWVLGRLPELIDQGLVRQSDGTSAYSEVFRTIFGNWEFYSDAVMAERSFRL